ncbi:MAG: Rrf2 family transcriptional regulator [Planctomycetota bacterium]|jgi:Rrf2 family protein|nr:Rrf2 family transcriptional regulator [Planctomycetota bacterium]
MHFTQETDYALRLVFAFSRLSPGTFLSAAEIAQQNRIPYRFLLRVLKKLKKAGVIASRQGPDGGYRLGRAARDISLLDVVEAVEGEVHINRCLRNLSLCNAGNAPECAVHRALGSIEEKFRRELEKKHFASLGAR